MSKVTELIDKIRKEYLTQIEDFTNKIAENKSKIAELEKNLQVDNIDSYRSQLSTLIPDIDSKNLTEEELLTELEKSVSSNDIAIGTITQIKDIKEKIEEFMQNKENILSENAKVNAEIQPLQEDNSNLYYQIYTIQSQELIGLEKTVNDIALEKINDVTEQDLDTYIKQKLESSDEKDLEELNKLSKADLKQMLISEFSAKSELKEKKADVKSYKDEQVSELENELFDLYSKRAKKADLSRKVEDYSSRDIKEVESYFDELEKLTQEYLIYSTATRKQSTEKCNQFCKQAEDIRKKIEQFDSSYRKKGIFESKSKYDSEKNEKKGELQNQYNSFNAQSNKEFNDYNNKLNQLHAELENKFNQARAVIPSTCCPLFYDNDISKTLEYLKSYKQTAHNELSSLTSLKDNVESIDLDIKKLEESIATKGKLFDLDSKTVDELIASPSEYIQFVGSTKRSIDLRKLNNNTKSYSANDNIQKSTTERISKKYTEQINTAVSEDMSKKSDKIKDDDDGFER